MSQKYGMFLKLGKEVICKKEADNLTTAYNYFSKLKDMSLVAFKKIFVVTKL
jgi:hypothetical protein|tara:strand:+ start:964 stop:1119 length:156 start_codon:yes stop_codon:yes gene_type:complete